jgi:hypothetical protein
MKFQDSQGIQRAYLAESAEMAYNRRNEHGKWGIGLESSSPLHDDRHKRNEFRPYVQGVLYVSVTNGLGRLLSEEKCEASPFEGKSTFI